MYACVSHRFRLCCVIGAWLLAGVRVGAADINDTAVALYLQAVAPSGGSEADPGVIQRKIVLLQAAARVDPHLTAAYRQLVSSALQIGRTDLAKWSAGKLLAETPQDALVQLQLTELQLNDLQTVEAKHDFIQQAMARDRNLLPEVASDLYRQLGEFAWQGYDRPRAEKYLRNAISTAEQNLKAHQMLIELADTDDDSNLALTYARRAHALLAAVTANPLNTDTYVQIAVLAGRAGLPVELEFWLAARRQLIRHLNRKDTMPVGLKLDLAESALAAGLGHLTVVLLTPLIGATTTAPATLPTQPTATLAPAVEANIHALLAVAAQRLNDKDGLQKHESWFQAQYEAMLDSAKIDRDAAAVAAVYAAVYARDFDNPTLAAMKFANHAYRAGRRPTQLATRAAALAYARAAEFRRAYQLIDQLDHPNDPLAVLADVWARLAENKSADAARTLRKHLANIPPGPLRETLVEIWTDLSTQKPPEPDLTAVRERFEQFDHDLLVMPYRPDEYVKLQLATRGDLVAGDFVRIDLTLVNVGNFRLAMGPASFIDPVADVHIAVTGSRPATFTIGVPLAKRQLLDPGQKVTARAFLDQARSPDEPAWPQYLARYADTIDRITVQAALHPVDLLRSTVVQIAAPAADRQMLNTLLAELRAPEPVNWQWANRAERLMMHPERKDHAASLTRAMVKPGTPGDPESSAVIAFLLRYAKPGPAVFNALAGKLEDTTWLCRLFAIDSLGKLQGPAAEKLYQHYAQNDDDELVRQLATAYLLRKWKP